MTSKNFLRDKQNQPFVSQPRQSLKKSMTSKKKPQRSEGRMSMLPLKRQRLSSTIQSQLMATTTSRPSTGGLKPNLNFLNTINQSSPYNPSLYNSCQKSIRKQTIITNLVNKLDEEEQLRTIIESKLRRTFSITKGNSLGQNNKEITYTSEFVPDSGCSNLTMRDKLNYNSNRTSFRQSEKRLQFNYEISSHKNQQPASVLNQKLRQCQQQLSYFKSIVSQLSKKVNILEGNPNHAMTARNPHENIEFYRTQNISSMNNLCSECIQCQGWKRFEKQSFKSAKNMAVQTQLISYDKKYVEKDCNQEDFFDNLQKTLKILDKTKKL